MTWSVIASVSTAFAEAGGGENGYVLAGYMVQDYIEGGLLWTVVSDVSTSWS
jgi:hypothetical protein